MLEQFATDFKIRGHRAPSPNTVRTYRNVVSLYLQSLDGREPSEATHRGYVKRIISEHTKGYALVAHSAISAYHRWRGVPAAEMDIRPERSKKPFLTHEEVMRLLQVCRTERELAVITVLYETAVRASELLGIRWDDIDWQAGFVTVTRKGGEREDVPLYEESLARLRDLERISRSRAHVFPFDYNHLYYMIRRIGHRAGLRVSAHDLRHARAAQLRRQGIAMDRIQGLLGHQDAKVTYMYYAHLTPHDLKRDVPAGVTHE